MINRKPLIGVIVLLVIGSVAVWYSNSLTMSEREHGLQFPPSSNVIKTNIAWWLPFNMKHDTFSKSVIRMSRSDFDQFIRSFDNCVKCAPYECAPGSMFTLFPVKHGDVTTIEVVEATEGTVLINVNTVYA